MSDFVEKLTHFCATHNDGSVLSLGGRVQLAVFSAVTNAIGNRVFTGWPGISSVRLTDALPEANYRAREIISILIDAVVTECLFFSYFSNSSTILKGHQPASLYDRVLPDTVLNRLYLTCKGKEANLEALEFALALLSFHFNGSQKAIPEFKYPISEKALADASPYLVTHFQPNTFKSPDSASTEELRRIFGDYAVRAKSDFKASMQRHVDSMNSHIGALAKDLAEALHPDAQNSDISDLDSFRAALTNYFRGAVKYLELNGALYAARQAGVEYLHDLRGNGEAPVSDFEKTLVRMLLAWFPTAGYAVDRKFEASLKEKWGL